MPPQWVFFVAVRRGQAEGGDHAVWIDHQRDLEPIAPLGLGAASAEGSLPGENPLAARPHSHDGRDEGGIHHVVDGRSLAELSSEILLQEAQFGLQVANAPVELALGAEGKEVGTKVRGGESPEVALATEARPLSEDR